MYGWEEEVLPPVSGGQHQAVVQELVHPVNQVLLALGRVRNLVEMLKRKRQRNVRYRGLYWDSSQSVLIRGVASTLQGS